MGVFPGAMSTPTMVFAYLVQLSSSFAPRCFAYNRRLPHANALSLLGLLHSRDCLLPCKGLCKENKIAKIRDYYGSGWVGPGLTRNFFCGKSTQHSSKPVQISGSTIPYVFCMYIHC